MSTLSSFLNSFLILIGNRPLIGIVILLVMVGAAWFLSRFALHLLAGLIRVGCFLVLFLGLLVLVYQLLQLKLFR